MHDVESKNKGHPVKKLLQSPWKTRGIIARDARAVSSGAAASRGGCPGLTAAMAVFFHMGLSENRVYFPIIAI